MGLRKSGLKLASIAVTVVLATPVAAETAFEKAAAAVMGEVNTLWSDLLGGIYRDALWTTFTTKTQTPCGEAHPERPPFYCPVDARIYLGFGFFDAVAQQIPNEQLAQFVMSAVVAHEIGHHVQFLEGVGRPLDSARDALESAGKTPASQFLSQRFELQADCYSGIWAHWKFQDMTPAEVKAAHAATAQLAHLFDEDTEHVATHGNGDQRMHWFDAGSAVGQPGACDTFAKVNP